MPSKTNCTPIYEPITVNTISRIIGDLKPKTSTGVDNISNKLLKFVKNVISELLSIIINQMLKLGIFSDSLKYLKLSHYIKKMMTHTYQIIDLFHCYLLYLKIF